MLKGIMKILWTIAKVYLKANTLAWMFLGFGTFVMYARKFWPEHSPMEMLIDFYEIAISGWKIMLGKSEVL